MNKIKKKYIKELYIEFIRGYINKKNRKLLIRTRNIDYDEFVIAHDGMVIKPMCGSFAKTIIVPRGVNVIYNDLGHNVLLFLDGFNVIGRNKVDLYLYDIPSDIIPKIQDELLEDIRERYNYIMKKLHFLCYCKPLPPNIIYSIAHRCINGINELRDFLLGDNSNEIEKIIDSINKFCDEYNKKYQYDKDRRYKSYKRNNICTIMFGSIIGTYYHYIRWFIFILVLFVMYSIIVYYKVI